MAYEMKMEWEEEDDQKKKIRAERLNKFTLCHGDMLAIAKPRVHANNNKVYMVCVKVEKVIEQIKRPGKI